MVVFCKLDRVQTGNSVFATILSYDNSFDPTLNTSLLSPLCFVSLLLYPSGLPGKGLTLYCLDSGGPYFGGHSFVSGGYVLAKEGIGKVCNAPEGMGKVFSILIIRSHPRVLLEYTI